MIASKMFVRNVQLNFWKSKSKIPEVASLNRQIHSYILTKEVNKNGLILLNRPSVLNAMSLEMIDKFSSILSDWNHTKSLIIVRGEKVFCAGGDVVRTIQSGGIYSAITAKDLYAAVYKVATLNIPYIALMDGITMGTGLGLAVHGKYRVATERTVVAMPEAMIGKHDCAQLESSFDHMIKHFFHRFSDRCQCIILFITASRKPWIVYGPLWYQIKRSVKSFFS